MGTGKASIVLLGLLAASLARADRMGNDGGGYGGAKDTANNGNQNYLQPQMLGHLANAAQHMQKAQQAEQQQNFGQANQERQMAAMEQQKAQQLGDQMKANNQSAQQNKEGQNQTRDQEKNNGNPLVASQQDNGRPARESADYQRASTTVGGSALAARATAAPTEAAPNLPLDQLANLSAAAFATPAVAVRASAEAERADLGGATRTVPDTSLTMISTPKNDSNQAPPALAPVTGAAVATSGASYGSASVSAPVVSDLSSSDRLLASAKPVTALDSEKDFWKAAKAEESATSEPTPHLLGAPGEDATPGRKLSDAAFWKRAGGEPASCRTRVQKGKRAHARCLREARRKLEKKWKERKLASTAR